MRTNQVWLDSLKPGDKFCAADRHEGYILYEVLKRTKAYIFTKPRFAHLTEGTRFRVEDGRVVGSGTWSTTYAEPITDAIRATWKRKRVYTRVANYDFSNLSTELLEQIYLLLPEIDKKG